MSNLPEVAVSTVAMSMFSTLNVHGPMRFEALVQVMGLQGFSCSLGEAEAGARELLNRKFIDESGGVLCSRYPRGWVVALRNREDPSGWGGWVMKNLSTNQHVLVADMKPER
jgi:hypothetical protein